MQIVSKTISGDNKCTGPVHGGEEDWSEILSKRFSAMVSAGIAIDFLSAYRKIY